MIILQQVGGTFGAPMGRRETHVCPDDEMPLEFQLERMPLVDGAYDAGGAYWGSPDNLYCAQCFVQDEKDELDIDIIMFIRADSRDAAMETVKDTYPNATFAPADLDEFLEAYITAALWSSMDVDPDGCDYNLDDHFSIHDIAPATMIRMKADCDQFQIGHAEDLAKAYKHVGYTKSSAGHDFWLTRCGHGAGFWDRNLGEVGERLTEACRKAGNVDLEVGDDNQIHQMGA